MEDGVLTDSQGRRVDFKNAIIVMTSNVGAKNITEKKKTLGFSTQEASEDNSAAEIRDKVIFELKHTFKPEFLNRIDDIIVFHQLSKDNIREITLNMLREVSKRLEKLGIDLTASDEAVSLLADTGYDPVYGARPLRRAIQSAVEDRAAEQLLEGTLKRGDKVRAVVEEGKIKFNAGA
jgi:ATP-dependent Clp protease ATP-binding subunit ClpC